MSRFSFVVPSLLVIAAALTGCGKNLKPMTDAQKDRFRSTITHVGNVAGGVATAQPTAREAIPLFDALDTLAVAAPGEVAGAPAQNNKEIALKLKQAIDRKDCDLSHNIPKSKGDVAIDKQLWFKLEGAKCPMALSATFQGSGNQTGGSADFKLTFKITDADLLKLSDIDEASIEGSLKMSGSQSSGGGSFSGQMSLKGTFHSQTEGNLTVYLDASGDGKGSQSGFSGNLEFAFGITYADFTGELKIKAELAAVPGASQGTSPLKNIEYYVNGEKVTETEFASYVKSILDQFPKKPH